MSGHTIRAHRRRLLAASFAMAVACSSGGDDVGRFVAVGSAVVRDARTGLEWTRRDDGAGLDWNAADAYCRSSSAGNGGGWRLPSIDELRRLYDETMRTPCGTATCRIDPVFTLASPYVWSATAQMGPNARTYLDFQYGTELSPSITPRLVRNVICVRDGQAGSLR